MAGAYCKFCTHRCFVERIVPAGPQRGWTGHLATCASGKEYDRTQTGGYDSSNSVNPTIQPKTAARVRQTVEYLRRVETAQQAGQERRVQMYADEVARLDAIVAEQLARGDEAPDLVEADVDEDDLAHDPDAMESMYPRDREDGEGIHRPSYGE